jgi:predicted unusual protein kinase regulating ubiquinone biosynthesis (AarF/ABC1/UbiB family)
MTEKGHLPQGASERNKLSGRLRRYAQVSSNISGSATRFLAERFLGLEINHDAQARALTMALGNLKGPVMKIAQMLGTIPDAVPQEYALEFMSLQADAPSMGWPFVRRRMQSELGAQWQTKFKHFDHQACSAASLGQVHKATHLNGTALACKLQYPDMASTIEADLKQLKFILKIYESTFGAVKTEGILTEISDRLREELDYEREARHIKLYQEILQDFRFIHLPQIFADLSTQRLLTMEWLEGRRLVEILDASQEYRNKIAEQLFMSWYYPLYNWGVIHGDPHLGNYTFRPDGGINLLDFGCLRHFKPEFIQGVLNLYQALHHNDDALAVHAYEQWGFKNLSKDMLEVLNLWAKLLYEPLLEDRVRPLQKDNRGIAGRETADKVHQELKRLGGIAPPREFVFMDRAAVGVGSACLHLRAEANWHQLFNRLIADFSTEKMHQRQATAQEKFGLALGSC